MTRNTDLRRRFTYEVRLDDPSAYLDDLIDFSSCEWLQIASQGKRFYMSATTYKPMTEGPFKMGDNVFRLKDFNGKSPHAINYIIEPVIFSIDRPDDIAHSFHHIIGVVADLVK